MSEDKSESLFESVVGAFKERISHPVAGVFVIAWLICNWQFLFYLVVADDPASGRMNEALFYCNWWKGFIFPAIATVLYLALSPLFGAGVSRWNDLVAGKEAERIYNDQLAALAKENYLASKRLQSGVPALAAQEQAKVTLETTNKLLEEKKARLVDAINDVLDVTKVNWEEFFRTQKHLNANVSTVSAAERIAAVFIQLKRIDELKAELRNKYPEIQWDRLNKP